MSVRDITKLIEEARVASSADKPYEGSLLALVDRLADALESSETGAAAMREHVAPILPRIRTAPEPRTRRPPNRPLVPTGN